ncbi:MAG: hypothetical protein B7Y02_07090 [Rhodobacterales bacterium 17-64-5]|nr:MAG: hypothetical protein B7Y02_07090 [Rhodobacterales bacterium 17-64-5]
MDSLRNTPPAQGSGAEPQGPTDLSALSWVHDELRRSIELALKALRRHARELEAGAAPDDGLVDPAQLQAARQHLHHGVGALELTGLPAASRIMTAATRPQVRIVKNCNRSQVRAPQGASPGLAPFSANWRPRDAMTVKAMVKAERRFTVIGTENPVGSRPARVTLRHMA